MSDCEDNSASEYEDGYDNNDGTYDDDDYDSNANDDYIEDYEIPVTAIDSSTSKTDNSSVDLDPEFLAKYSAQGTSTGSKRLMEELKKFTPEYSSKFGYSIDLYNDKLYNWRIKLFDFPNDSKLYQDLKTYNSKYGIDHIMLDVTFPDQYPYKPPFIRVLYPRFMYMTGHITIGGSICMEVLTTTGWSPGYSTENLLMQIKSEIIDPSGEARIDLSRRDEYGVQEAKEAFDRLCMKYGWNK